MSVFVCVQTSYYIIFLDNLKKKKQPKIVNSIFLNIIKLIIIIII